MSTWRTILGILLIFLAGILVGMGATRFYVKHRIEKVVAGGPPAARELVVRQLSRELGLDASQREEVARVVERGQARMTAVRAKYQPEVEQIVADSVAQIEPSLSPSQRAKLQALHEKVRARWQTPPGT